MKSAFSAEMSLSMSMLTSIFPSLAVDCGPPPIVSHAEMYLLGNTTLGSYVAYTCMLGFQLKNGQNTSMCTANGTWEDVSLICEGELKATKNKCKSN